MAQIDAIRNGIIDKLLAISDKEYLTAIFKLLDSSDKTNHPISLSSEQKLMLELSENDLKEGKIITQEELDKKDLEWLRSK